MINQEKVLHGLDSCGFYNGMPNICEITECPYRDDKCGCVHELAHDASLLISELLKAQEPLEPRRDSYLKWRCGNCNTVVDKYGGDRYCPNCGRKVKWDD